MRVVVVTHLASPYQAELFNAVSSSGAVELKVVYLHRTSINRSWQSVPLLHDAVCLDEEPQRRAEVQTQVRNADFVVFNYYAHCIARRLIRTRVESNKAWCFWGERPGFRLTGWSGRLIRRWYLSSLHRSKAPIWGIGRFALERYQSEFGLDRIYCNIPYFSDLERFRSRLREPKRSISERRFLFSGSLIRRKGVDLLARAFVRLARTYSHVRLMFLGEGELHETLKDTLRPVADNVVFLGFKDWKELPGCYAAADVLCVPSRYDGWGLVVPEGLASGLPVIGTNAMGAAVEFIENGSNGWLIPAADEEALFAALQDAALLPEEKLTAMSLRARASIAGHSLQNGAERFSRAAHEAFSNWSG